MRLKDFILTYVNEDTPLGDSARQVRDDKRYPKSTLFSDEVAYLRFHGDENTHLFIDAYSILEGFSEIDDKTSVLSRNYWQK